MSCRSRASRSASPPAGAERAAAPGSRSSRNTLPVRCGRRRQRWTRETSAYLPGGMPASASVSPIEKYSALFAIFAATRATSRARPRRAVRGAAAGWMGCVTAPPILLPPQVRPAARARVAASPPPRARPRARVRRARPPRRCRGAQVAPTCRSGGSGRGERHAPGRRELVLVGGALAREHEDAGCCHRAAAANSCSGREWLPIAA